MFQDNELAWELAEYFRLESDEIKLFRSRKIKKPKTVRSKIIKKEKSVKKAFDSKKIEDKKIEEKSTSSHPQVKKTESSQNKKPIEEDDKLKDSVKRKSDKKASKSKSKEKQVSLLSFK
jgi:replication factor C large subunit